MLNVSWLDFHRFKMEGSFISMDLKKKVLSRRKLLAAAVFRMRNDSYSCDYISAAQSL